jgi:hypothetical protein
LVGWQDNSARARRKFLANLQTFGMLAKAGVVLASVSESID